ncbi:MAG: TonB-dependent receptor plug domain-containing protein [Bacteroidia bacterium]|nr:TonB-dependent receptor plug domain-containing protein [Bacteroidia bacterium]
MRLKTFFLFLLFVLFISSITAQKNSNKITITGTVLDGNKNPVVDAIVMIDNQRTNSITDSEGNYKIKVKPDASRIGIFTFGNGYFEEEINGRTRINISFRTVWTQNNSNYGIMELRGRNTPSGEEVVEVGYAHMKKKYLTTDISYIDGTNKKYASYSSVYDMIQREVSGVMIMGKSVIIQGSSNLFGYVGALVIIDGAYGGSLDDISPSLVKSISVLKGTAAAIYGSRGFGGAIIIKTKTYDDY